MIIRTRTPMNGTLTDKQLQMLLSKSASSEKKRKTIVDRYLEDIGLGEDELRRRKRLTRAASLPEEDRGLVYWEEYCEDQGRDTIPTLESLEMYANDFVAPLEEKMLGLRRLDPTIAPVRGVRDFLQPVLRIGRKQQQQQKQHQPFTMATTTMTRFSSPRPIRALDSRPGTSAMHAAARLEASSDSDTEDQDLDPKAANAAASLKYGDYSQFKANEFVFLTVGGQNIKSEKNFPPHLHLSEDLQSVGDVLQEWRFGFEGAPSIQENNSKYGGRWRTNQKSLYEMRSMVVIEFVRLVKEDKLSSQQAVQNLIRLQGSRTVTKLGKEVKTLKIRRKNARLDGWLKK